MWNVVELLGGEVEPIQSHLGGRTRSHFRGLGGWLTVSLVAVVVAGCGGSSSGGTSATSAVATTSSSTSAATPASTQAAPSSSMASAAEKICGELNAKLAAETKAIKSLSAIPSAVSRRVPMEKAALSELAKLKPPAGIARAWAQIIAYRRTLEGDLVRYGEKIRRKEFNSINVLTAANATVERELLAVGQRTGFEQCARVG
jgi:hypothetical protein